MGAKIRRTMSRGKGKGKGRKCPPVNWTRNFLSKYNSGHNLYSSCPPPAHMTPDGCMSITMILQ